MNLDLAARRVDDAVAFQFCHLPANCLFTESQQVRHFGARERQRHAFPVARRLRHHQKDERRDLGTGAFLPENEHQFTTVRELCVNRCDHT
ncbi:MAG: hypothetical protein WBN09_15135 [Woeseiaceae bacterium]